jgi:hypothetical protein
MKFHECVLSGKGLELVEGSYKFIASLFGDLLSYSFGKTDVGVQTGTHGCTSLGELEDLGQFALYALDSMLYLVGVGRELLAKGQRGGILCMRSSYFDDLVEFLHLTLQGIMEQFKSWQQFLMRFQHCCNMHGSGEAIIARLTAIDVIVGMHGLLAQLTTQDLDGAISDHLVGVHVGLGTRPRLPDHQGEMVIQLALDHFVGSSYDSIS